jgi:hypothetical protein
VAAGSPPPKGPIKRGCKTTKTMAGDGKEINKHKGMNGEVQETRK